MLGAALITTNAETVTQHTLSHVFVHSEHIIVALTGFAFKGCLVDCLVSALWAAMVVRCCFQPF